jgi:hypothetical protein
MFDPSREAARRFFFETWRKYRAGEPLAGLETLAIEVILLHPEYHPVLAQPERHLDRDYPVEAGETNPFLHLALHLALLEQLSIDQPPGIRARYTALLERGLAPHDAAHVLIDCLGEMVWHAQRHHTPPDAGIYFGCIDAQLAKRPATGGP